MKMKWMCLRAEYLCEEYSLFVEVISMTEDKREGGALKMESNQSITFIKISMNK